MGDSLSRKHVFKIKQGVECTQRQYRMQRSRIKSLTNDSQPVSVSEDSDLFAKMESKGEHRRAYNISQGSLLILRNY